MISYYDANNGDVKLLHCGDTNCSAGNSVVVVDEGGFSGTSLGLGLGGEPLVSYEGNFDRPLRVMDCANPNCTAGTSTVAAPAGREPSLALDSDGRPVISYRLSGPEDLGVLHCATTTCSSKLADGVPDGVVGGIAELPNAATSPVETSISSAPNVAPSAAVAAVVILVLGGAAWYARRRAG